jgi:CRP-like cAMP-binding protein
VLALARIERAYHRRPLDDRGERLRGIPLFAELDDEALERVAAIATETEFPPGALLIERGHPGLGLFVILDGTVRADVRDRHADFGPSEFVGELSLLVDRMPRATRVRAETPVRALAISRADFLALLESEPSIAIAMLRIVATRLAHLLDAPH